MIWIFRLCPHWLYLEDTNHAGIAGSFGSPSPGPVCVFVWFPSRCLATTCSLWWLQHRATLPSLPYPLQRSFEWNREGKTWRIRLHYLAWWRTSSLQGEWPGNDVKIWSFPPVSTASKHAAMVVPFHSGFNSLGDSGQRGKGGKRNNGKLWLFVAYSNGRWLLLPVLTTAMIHYSLEGWENVCVLGEKGKEQIILSADLLFPPPPCLFPPSLPAAPGSVRTSGL